MLKDIGLALQAAVDNDISLPLTKGASELYERICADGADGKDFSFVYEFLSKGK